MLSYYDHDKLLMHRSLIFETDIPARLLRFLTKMSM